LFWMPNGTMHFLSADSLSPLENSLRISRFEIDIDFPSCFGVNDGVEHADMQRSECVSMSGLHTGEDRTLISVVAGEIIEL
jgi:hypothetical protein